MMATSDTIRNGIIDKLLTISNKEYLSAIYELLNSSSVGKDKVKLTNEQVLMLKLSDNDIKNNQLISASQLDEEDFKWLKGL